MKTLLLSALATLVLSLPAMALSSYTVEVSYNDEWFVINGEKYQAKTWCFNVEEGDRVVFLEGSPYGACVSAAFANLRTKQVCEVWCE